MYRTRRAMNRLRTHPFSLVILSDGFDGLGLSHSPILQYLNNLPMSVRRKIFLALVGDTFTTMDKMTAYAMSANMVIHEKDLRKLSHVLNRAISDHKRFYRVFMDTLEEVGRA